jgi:periplasmic copper chaperone A
MKKFFTPALLAFLVGAAPALADNTASVTLNHGSVWQTAKVGDASQGFLQIHNLGSAADVLTAWSCPVAQATALVDGKGNALPSLTIPAGQTVTLAANGPHLLLQNTSDTIDYGSVVPCSFTFQQAGQIGGYLNSVVAPGK